VPLTKIQQTVDQHTWIRRGSQHRIPLLEPVEDGLGEEVIFGCVNGNHGSCGDGNIGIRSEKERGGGSIPSRRRKIYMG
jgi:hypothetical protein